MTSYRLYCLDGHGRISLADWIEAESDEAAIAEARTMKVAARKCEVWQGTRLVATLDSGSLAAPGASAVGRSPATKAASRAGAARA